MRIAFIIICLSAIGVTLVQIRTQEAICRNKMLTLQNHYQLEVPRQLWQQQVELSYLTAPLKVQERAQEMALQLIDKDLKTPLARKTETDDTDSTRR